MLKAGLIAGVVAFFLVLIGAAGLSPLCALCVPLVSGLAAGFMTGMFEKPLPEDRMKRGAMAGAIAGGIALFGSMIAAVINGLVLQNPDYQIVNNAFGLPSASPEMVWISQFGINCCIGLVNVALNAGLGAGGVAIWASTAGKNSNTEIPPAS